MLRDYAASESTHPSAKAVELFQRALEIQAGETNEKWEPEGRRNEYIAIDIALTRELRGSVWGASALDVDENAEGPPAWVTNPWQIASWREAISWRRSLLEAVREAPEAGAVFCTAAQSEWMAIGALDTADRPVVRIWHPDDPKAYVEIQFETQAAADAAVEQWNGILKGATGIEFGKMPSHDRTRQERVRRRDEIPD
jgi:hypothetical protein